MRLAWHACLVLDDYAEKGGVIAPRGFHLLDLAGQVFVAGQHIAEFDEGADDDNAHLYEAPIWYLKD
jgi:hypothetical protein